MEERKRKRQGFFDEVESIFYCPVDWFKPFVQPSLASQFLTCGPRARAVAFLHGQGHSGEAEIDLEGGERERKEERVRRRRKNSVDRRFLMPSHSPLLSLFVHRLPHTSACVDAGSMLGRPQPACHL